MRWISEGARAGEQGVVHRGSVATFLPRLRGIRHRGKVQLSVGDFEVEGLPIQRVRIAFISARIGKMGLFARFSFPTFPDVSAYLPNPRVSCVRVLPSQRRSRPRRNRHRSPPSRQRQDGTTALERSETVVLGSRPINNLHRLETVSGPGGDSRRDRDLSADRTVQGCAEAPAPGCASSRSASMSAFPCSRTNVTAVWPDLSRSAGSAP